MGIDPKDIGVHSIRKGAATYTCSGTTCAPSMAAVCNRAGWTMGKVKDTYIQYEAAINQYVGRIVAGLNINSYKFSVSPPHLNPAYVDRIDIFQEDIRNVFPFVVPTEYQLVTQFCYASLVYFKTFLHDNIGIQSPLRSNILLRNGLRSDSSFVCIRYAHEECTVHLTGIPPHVITLIQLETMLGVLRDLEEKQRTNADVIVERIMTQVRVELDDRSIGGGEVSMSRIQNLLAPLREELGRLNQSVIDQSSNRRADHADEGITNGDDASPPPSDQIYTWGGKWRHLPEGWKFARNMTVLSAWQAWHHGDNGIPPLKRLQPLDVTDNHMILGKSRPIRAAELRYLQRLKWLCGKLDCAANFSARNSPSYSDLVLQYNTPAIQNILPSSAI